MTVKSGICKVALAACAVALSACGALEEMATQADCAQKYSEHATGIDDESTVEELIETQEQLLEDEEFLNCGFGDHSDETDAGANTAPNPAGEGDSVEVDSSVVATTAEGDSVEVDSPAASTANGGLIEINSADDYNAACRLSEEPVPGSLDNPHPIGQTVTACMDGAIWTYSIDYVRVGEPTGTPLPLMGTNYDCAVVVGTAKLEWYNQGLSSQPLFPWSELAAGGEWGSPAAWACEANPELAEGIGGDRGMRTEPGTTQKWFSLFRIDKGSNYDYVEIAGNYFSE